MNLIGVHTRLDLPGGERGVVVMVRQSDGVHDQVLLRPEIALRLARELIGGAEDVMESERAS